MKAKTKGFLQGAAILAIANLVVKVIGAFYKIPLDRMILQTDGMALYNAAYTIYNVLFVISTAGLPVAISKLVSEAVSKGNNREANKIFRISMLLLLTMGTLGMLFLFFGARNLANLLVLPNAYLAMMAMAPSLLLVSCVSAFRGYFQGLQNMVPTAISEVLEAMGKLCIGLSLAYLLLPQGKPMAAAGGILGVTLGSGLAFIFVVFYYVLRRKSIPRKNDQPLKIASSKTLLKKIIIISVPITIGAAVFTLTSLIDTAMVSRQMHQYIGSDVLAQSAQASLTAEKWAVFTGYMGDYQKMVEFIFGYLGRAITMFNFPPAVIQAIAIAVVPAIAAANAVKNRNRAQNFTSAAVRITVLLALPCAVGMSVLAKPILMLVYGDGSYSSLLNIMGISVVFATLVQVANAVLQAWGKVWIPVCNMLIGGIVKVGVNLFLVSIPEININGAPIGTLLCYLTVITLNLYAISRITGVKYEFMAFAKPAVASGVMGLCALFTYNALFRLLDSNLLALGGAVVFSVMVYVVVLFAVKGMKEEDILLLPKGEALARLLKKVKLL